MDSATSVADKVDRRPNVPSATLATIAEGIDAYPDVAGVVDARLARRDDSSCQATNAPADVGVDQVLACD